MKQLGMVMWAVMQLVCFSGLQAQEKEAGFNKSAFYSAMRGDNVDDVNRQLALVQAAAIPQKIAYEGALLMKKAGIVSGPKKKLDLFKDGHKKLEGVIEKDTANTEFRFLRFMIQEHAPGILGYKKELEKDKLYIKNNYKKLPAAVQSAVVDYSKQSKILKPGDL